MAPPSRRYGVVLARRDDDPARAQKDGAWMTHARVARPRGRPRSEAVDRAIASAALEELRVVGFHALSIDSIAARAGVSKVSVYRRWSSKLEAVADVMRRLGESSVPDDKGSLAADVRALFGSSGGSAGELENARFLMRTLGEIVDNAELLSLYRSELFGPRLAQMTIVVERARGRGELRPGLSVEVAAAMIAGPLFLGALVSLVDTDSRLSEETSEELIGTILRAISP